VGLYKKRSRFFVTYCSFLAACRKKQDFELKTVHDHELMIHYEKYDQHFLIQLCKLFVLYTA